MSGENKLMFNLKDKPELKLYRWMKHWSRKVKYIVRTKFLKFSFGMVDS